MTPPVVLLHGAFCGPFAFDPWRVHFEARGLTCLAPALRHHDGPARAAPARELGATSLLDYAADLERLIRALPAPPILIGHSMGGLLAQMLAARGLAAAAILLAPSAPWGVPPSSEIEMFGALGLALAGPFCDAPLFPDRWVALHTGIDRLAPADRRRFLANLRPESGRATFEVMCWMWDTRRASQVDAARLRCPLLAVAAEHDGVTPPSTVRAIARRYGTNAEYRCQAGFGHWLLAEPGWQAIADECLDWLAARGVASASSAKGSRRRPKQALA